MSLTQTGNYTALAGVLVYVLNLLGVHIVQEEIEKVIIAVVCIVGIVTSWIGRYRIGDLTAAGTRKPV